MCDIGNLFNSILIYKLMFIILYSSFRNTNTFKRAFQPVVFIIIVLSKFYDSRLTDSGIGSKLKFY